MLSTGIALTETAAWNTKTGIQDKTIVYPQVSGDGNAFAYILAENAPLQADSVPLIPLISLEIMTKTGKHLSLPAAQDWWQLGPELSPGHFGILVVGKDKYAQLWNADWSSGQINLTLVKQLPFQIAMGGYLFQQIVYIAPDWSAIAYTVGDDFQIYSLRNNKLVWDYQNVGDKYPELTWAMTSNVLAIVNMGLSDGDGKLIAISPSGNSKTLADMSVFFGADASITLFTPTTNSAGQMAIMARAAGVTHPVVVDVNNGQITPLCVPDPLLYEYPNWYLYPNLQWINNGPYFSLQRAGDDDVTPSKVLIFSAQTGGYAFFYPVINNQLVWVLAWS